MAAGILYDNMTFALKGTGQNLLGSEAGSETYTKPHVKLIRLFESCFGKQCVVQLKRCLYQLWSAFFFKIVRIVFVVLGSPMAGFSLPGNVISTKCKPGHAC